MAESSTVNIGNHTTSGEFNLELIAQVGFSKSIINARGRRPSYDYLLIIHVCKFT